MRIVNETEVENLGKQLILEGQAMDKDLGVNLTKVSKRGGTAKEREERGTLLDGGGTGVVFF